jgi:hypothetical protein
MPPAVWPVTARKATSGDRLHLMHIRRSLRFLEDCRELRCVISGEEGATRLVNLILWLGVKGVVGLGYAPLITGVSTTRGNSGNGALPTREPAHGEDQSNAGQ